MHVQNLVSFNHNGRVLILKTPEQRSKTSQQSDPYSQILKWLVKVCDKKSNCAFCQLFREDLDATKALFTWICMGSDFKQPHEGVIFESDFLNIRAGYCYNVRAVSLLCILHFYCKYSVLNCGA